MWSTPASATRCCRRTETECKVLAAVVPGPILAEYEAAVRAAGYEPGAVLPSSLAALEAVDSMEAVLAANLSAHAITTTIATGQDLLLYRTLDLPEDPAQRVAEIQRSIAVAAAYFEDKLGSRPRRFTTPESRAPQNSPQSIGDPELTVVEWAPRPEEGAMTAFLKPVLPASQARWRERVSRCASLSISPPAPSPISARPSSACASPWPCSPRSASSSASAFISSTARPKRPAPASTRSTARSPAFRPSAQQPRPSCSRPTTRSCSTRPKLLNQLFDEKAFSWTLAMEAMETVLPAGVQVTSIEPIRDKDGHITVHLRVVGPRDRAVDLVRNLEHSRRFLQPRIVGENAESSNGPSQRQEPVSASNRFDFDLLAEYNPPTLGRTSGSAKTTRARQSSSSAPLGIATPPHSRGSRTPQQHWPQPYTGPAIPQGHEPPPSRNRRARRSAMSANGSSSTWRERLASPLTWHFAGFAVLLVLAIGLAIRLGLDWAAMNSHSSDVLAGKQIQLKALEIQTAPLRGLDQRVEKTREQMRRLLQEAHPAQLLRRSPRRIGDLAVASGVRLSRVQYTQGKPGSDLTEISMDAGISGDYPAIMRFINCLERDQIFFIIRAMSLTGQQGGLVNLRLRVSTWLRPADAAPAVCRPLRLPATSRPPHPAAGKEGE